MSPNLSLTASRSWAKCGSTYNIACHRQCDLQLTDPFPGPQLYSLGQATDVTAGPVVVAREGWLWLTFFIPSGGIQPTCAKGRAAGSSPGLGLVGTVGETGQWLLSGGEDKRLKVKGIRNCNAGRVHSDRGRTLGLFF